MIAASTRNDRAIALSLFALTFFVLLATEQPVGFVRDESVYFAAAESYARWFQLLVTSPGQALTDRSIVGAFDVNHEHPVFAKNLFGLSYLLFHEKLRWLRAAAAFRLPAFMFAGLLVSLTYLLARKLLERPAALFAAVSFLVIPRQFFHSHLACFDIPIAAMWLCVVYCFFEALHRPKWWLLTGVAFGLALATKHNAYFIPLVLIPFSLYRGWQTSANNVAARQRFFAIHAVYVAGAALYALLFVILGRERFQSGFLLQSPHTAIFVVVSVFSIVLLRQLRTADEATFRAVAPLVAMATIAPAIFYLHWPYLWHHPVERTVWYLQFHATHNHYAWFYMGQLLRAPPFPLEYVVMKTALTVPTALFLPMVLGLVAAAWRMLRGGSTLLESLIVANAVASVAIISHPEVPHFGGVKHWFPSMPFLAILAAASIERCSPVLGEWLNRHFKRFRVAFAQPALALLTLTSGAIATARGYEFGTSAYSELAGGAPGAASLGMQRQYWANNLTGVLPWLNANARANDRIFLHENHGGQIRDYQRNGMLRSDLRFVGSAFEADWVVYQYHQEFREHEFNAWQAFGTQKPVHGLYIDETPQIVVYKRR